MWEGPLVPPTLMRPEPHSRNLRLHRLSETPATFFITKSMFPKKAVLDQAARDIIVSAFAFAVKQQRIYLRAFVVMPDQHALLALCQPWVLPKFMHALMSYVAAKTAALLKNHNTSWQDGYYNTRVKTSKQFEFVTYYIEQNPVVKGLVAKADEWDASSARQRDLVTDPWPWPLDEE